MPLICRSVPGMVTGTLASQGTAAEDFGAAPPNGTSPKERAPAREVSRNSSD